MAINWRQYAQEALEKVIKEGNLPPIIGGGRRTIVIPEPRPEDERPRYKTEGEVPEGYVRADISRPVGSDGRLGSFWVHVKHQDKTNHVLERVFTGDIVDIPENEFVKLYERNWVREPWKPKASEKTKPQAA